jgi:hypothetical protein
VKQLLVFAAALVAAACAGRTASPAAPAPARTAEASGPAAEPSAALRYAAGTGHYRLESRTHMEQDVMGQSNAADITTNALFTAAIAEASGNLGVAITIDSLAITAPAGAADPAELLAARGKTVRLVVSPSGHAVSMTPPDGASATVQQVASGLREFLPPLPPGATAAGTAWSDTTSISQTSQGIPLTIHMARQHRIAGWEDRGGVRALHIATTSTYTLTGSGEVQGQAIELAGGGQSTSDVYVSAGGVYLGSAISDSSLVNANVVSAGMVVPVRRTTRSTFTRLP